jgi:hypothetical protein
MTAIDERLAVLRRWGRSQQQAYAHGESRPLGGYLALMTAYAAGTAGAGAAAKAMGKTAPVPMSPWELFQLSVATHKISRLIAKDPVTSPLRASFTTYQGLSAPSELHEEVRGHGLKHSVGELLTCPMCLAQWVATGLCVGLTVAPTSARLLIAVFSATAGSDFLQHLYVRLQQATQ